MKASASGMEKSTNVPSGVLAKGHLGGVAWARFQAPIQGAEGKTEQSTVSPFSFLKYRKDGCGFHVKRAWGKDGRRALCMKAHV
jgi:hypothetical protein